MTIRTFPFLATRSLSNSSTLNPPRGNVVRHERKPRVPFFCHATLANYSPPRGVTYEVYVSTCFPLENATHSIGFYTYIHPKVIKKRPLSRDSRVDWTRRPIEFETASEFEFVFKDGNDNYSRSSYPFDNE